MSLLNSKETQIGELNQKLFRLLSVYLNVASDYVSKEMIEAITRGDTAGDEFAFANIVASACGLDIYDSDQDKLFFRKHFLPCFSKLHTDDYAKNPYYSNIKFPKDSNGNWSFLTKAYKPYEAFVFDNPKVCFDGRIEPQIGFFDKEFRYPAVLENGREWMTITPNEINTITPAVSSAHGNALTFGLGLGYFVYMSALKSDVNTVTVIEKSREVIDLFEKSILPQFPDPSKVIIIEADAFDYAEKHMQSGGFDSIFVDIWHDPSDGCALYLRMKQYEHLLPQANFDYWIEDTLKLYI